MSPTATGRCRANRTLQVNGSIIAAVLKNENVARLMTVTTGFPHGIPNGPSNSFTAHRTFASGAFLDQGDVWETSQGGLARVLDNITLYLEDHPQVTGESSTQIREPVFSFSCCLLPRGHREP